MERENQIDGWKVIEFATKLYFKDYGFEAYFWKEWAEMNGLSTQDVGVDLVAKIEDEIYAVQCKGGKNKVELSDIGTFLASIERSDYEFDGGYIVAEDVTKKVEETIERFRKPIQFIPLSELEEYIGKAKNILKEASKEEEELRKEKKVLRPYQEEALRKILEGFEKYDRGKLIMPPGTGKTLVALKVAERFFEENPKALVLFLCPSIALLDQSIRVWIKDREIKFRTFAVVSDRDVGKRDDELGNFGRYLLFCPPTTKAEDLYNKVDRVLNYAKVNRPIVIFSTYQSLDVVMEAQKMGLPEFDLIICDEAHRTAGISNKDSNFKLVHHNDYIKSRKRLYMTATPRVLDIKDEKLLKEMVEIYSIYDMNDENTFGPTFYKYSFKRAIEENYLSPYRILIYTIGSSEVQKRLRDYLQEERALDVDFTTKLVCLSKVLNGETFNENGDKLDLKLKSGIIFVNRVEKSRKLAEDFKRIYRLYYGRETNVEIDHIDGTMSASVKRMKINKLKEASYERPFILSNAKVLTEGIDVPALDFVAYFDPRESVVDIIQSLGRVLRRAEGKEFGLIIIPLLVNENAENLDDKIDKTTYKTLWKILNAIASLDEAFQARIRLYLHRSNVYQIIAFVSDKVEIDEDIREHIKAKIVRSFRLSHLFLSDWASETAKIANYLREQVKNSLDKEDFRRKFDELKDRLRILLNESVSDDDTLSLIVQYVLTKPIFEKLFPERGEIYQLLDEFFDYFRNFLENNTDELKRYYEDVGNKAEGIVNDKERQDFLRRLYSNFFNRAFKDLSDELGIVYTPEPLVSFIINFTDYLLRKNFSKSLEDEGVVILDPFAGLGTFIALLMGRIPPEKLKGKLERKEIWANEILLLPYLAMLKNLSHEASVRLEEETEFKTALWTDSFRLMEIIYEEFEFQNSRYRDLFQGNLPKKLSELVQAQTQAKINVIISNPPWRAKRENENVGRKNIEYKNLRKRISETYAKNAKDLGAHLVKSLYDTYVQAIRMATDRINEGVIGLVLNNGWLEGLAGRGLRKSLWEEFSEVYVYDLKGDARKRGEQRKKEGDNIFGEQSRAGVCLLFLVKKNEKSGPAKIYYKSVKDYAKREEKFEELRIMGEKPEDIPWQEIVPDEKHDWINKGSKNFEEFIKLGDKKRTESALFELYSLGLLTGRDDYAYNFFPEELERNMRRLIQSFNDHLERVKRGEINEENLEEKIERDLKKIKWDSTLKRWLFRLDEPQTFSQDKIFKAFFRPFVPMFVYFDRVFNSAVCQLPSIFPSKDAENLAIAISSKGANYFDAFLVNRIVDRGFLENTQLFPLYRYEEYWDFGRKRIERVKNINPRVFEGFKNLDENISEEDVFYYVFGVLSSPSYRENFKNNLKMDLPRIPFPQDAEIFWKVSDLGRKLGYLQLNYTELPEFDEGFDIKANEEDLKEKVKHVRLDISKGTLILNQKVKVEKIPSVAWEYKICGYPPIRWISEYLYEQIKEDTSIKWDPNITVGEFISLAKKLTTLSSETLKIIEELRNILRF